jgi:hypothetical protein
MSLIDGSESNNDDDVLPAVLFRGKLFKKSHFPQSQYGTVRTTEYIKTFVRRYIIKFSFFSI